MLEAAAWAALLMGSFFCIVGGIGLIRMPDFYTRTHAASITDTLGAGLVLLGLMLQADGEWLVISKLIFIAGFLFVTSPTSSHALVKAAYADGVRHESPPEGGA
jgi:multicomponent Na+:H+ antiporter subunit G